MQDYYQESLHVSQSLQVFLDLLPVTQGAVLPVAIRPSIVYPGNVFIPHCVSQPSFSGIAVHVRLYHLARVLHTSWPTNILMASLAVRLCDYR